MLHDPLIAAVCTPEEVWQLTDELLLAQAKWLPNYSQTDIEAARARLECHEAEGTRVTLQMTEGAARLHTRSIAEMQTQAQEVRKLAMTSDKGDQA
jgi:alpha-galactosidase